MRRTRPAESGDIGNALGLKLLISKTMKNTAELSLMRLKRPAHMHRVARPWAQILEDTTA
jgi:hypothetical protein